MLLLTPAIISLVANDTFNIGTKAVKAFSSVPGVKASIILEL